MEAAISLTDETSSSAEVAMDSACVVVSPSDAAISLAMLTAESSERVCASAPSVTSFAIRAIVVAPRPSPAPPSASHRSRAASAFVPAAPAVQSVLP